VFPGRRTRVFERDNSTGQSDTQEAGRMAEEFLARDESIPRSAWHPKMLKATESHGSGGSQTGAVERT
jgi:hypothetical protein